MTRRMALSLGIGGAGMWVSLMLGLAIFHFQGGRLYWNIGISLTPGLYACWGRRTPLEPGMLVRFQPTPEHYARVQQAYGDTAVPPIWMKQIVRVESTGVWVEGSHPRSWDSRHFGPVAPHQITGTCTALWLSEKDTE
jgi:type IV secretory pathway protease TraF